MTDLAQTLAVIDSWPVDHSAAALVARDGTVLATHGDQDRRFPLASVTKLLSTYGVLTAVEEGALDLDQPAGPEGSTVRHLLAHTAGYDFDSPEIRATPGTRRLYSNTDFAVLAELVEAEADMTFAEFLREVVFEPLRMHATALEGPAGSGAVSTAADLSLFAAEVQSPTLLAPQTIAEARTVQFPGLRGVLPGYGSHADNRWGLGFELRGDKSPHWTGAGNSPETFGHFGQSGTFMWFDPAAGAALVSLSDRTFGPWAIEAWPPLSDGVLAALADG